MTDSGAYVDDFAIVVWVEDCDSGWEITHRNPANISNGSFSFTGAFYASGTFSSATVCSGQAGLDEFNIPDCGLVSGGPWNYTAYWEEDGWKMTLDIPAEAVVTKPLAQDSNVKQPFQARRARARE